MQDKPLVIICIHISLQKQLVDLSNYPGCRLAREMVVYFGIRN